MARLQVSADTRASHTPEEGTWAVIELAKSGYRYDVLVDEVLDDGGISWTDRSGNQWEIAGSGVAWPYYNYAEARCSGTDESSTSSRDAWMSDLAWR